MTQVIILFIVFTPDGGIVNFLSLSSFFFLMKVRLNETPCKLGPV